MNTDRQGWLGAAVGLAEILIRSPHFKARVETILRYLDPEAAAEFARVILRTDPALALRLLGALPDALNVGATFSRELLRQLGALPPTLLGGTVQALLGRITFHTLGEALGLGLGLGLVLGQAAAGLDPGRLTDLRQGLEAGLGEALGPTPDQALASLLLGGGRAILGGVDDLLAGEGTLSRAMEQVTAGLPQLLAEHPRVVQHLLLPLVRSASAIAMMAMAGGPAGVAKI